MADNILGNIPKEHSKDDPRRTYEVVVAATRDMGIGKDGKLPWRLTSDLKFFKELTLTTLNPAKKNAVIMDRRTWESIPIEKRPLLGRLNVVLTRSENFDIATVESVVVCSSMNSALDMLASSPYCFSIEKVFVIAGDQMLRDALNAPGCDAIHLTDIEANIECDTFIPTIDVSTFQPWCSSSPSVNNNIRYSFVTYVRRRSQSCEFQIQYDGCETNGDLCKDRIDNQEFSFLPKKIFERHEEYSYLKLLECIISQGGVRRDPLGIERLSKFSCKMSFNLRKSFPLLTTKRIFWQGVVEELLWFISGSTNIKVLHEKGIHISDGNALRYRLNSAGLAHREEGDLGPFHSFQWRHMGAEYNGMHADYVGKGFDQLSYLIDEIKEKSDVKLSIQSACDYDEFLKTRLPPTDMLFQFHVVNGELSCMFIHGVAEMGLTVPFYIASYSLLICMIAQVCDLVPGDFFYCVGEANIYRSHVSALQEQLHRQPKPFPILKINPEKKDIDSFTASDFNLVGYDPHPEIEMKMPE